jgi:hypothetical protein
MRYRLRTLLIVMFLAAIAAAFIGSGVRAYRRTLDITRGSIQDREQRQAVEHVP